MSLIYGEYLLALIFIKIQFLERNSEGHTQINMRPLDLDRRSANPTDLCRTKNVK